MLRAEGSRSVQTPKRGIWFRISGQCSRGCTDQYKPPKLRCRVAQRSRGARKIIVRRMCMASVAEADADCSRCAYQFTLWIDDLEQADSVSNIDRANSLSTQADHFAELSFGNQVDG